jgi:hypothetical protein
MRTDLIIVDNFYADPWAVREYALRQPYYFPYEQRADVQAGKVRPTWMASAFKRHTDCPFKSSVELIKRLGELVGEPVDLDHWQADFPLDEEGRPSRDAARHPGRGCVWNCAFHCKPENGQRLGGGVHNHVTDLWNGVTPDGWAGLIYLNRDAPLSGGLHLWRTRDPEHQYDWMTPAENWELIDSLGNVANRLILARGNLPHSGAGGWGDSLDTGRLYQTMFFRTTQPERPASVSIDLGSTS